MEDLCLCDGVTLSLTGGGETDSIVRTDGKCEINLTNFTGKVILTHKSTGCATVDVPNKPLPIPSRMTTSSVTPSWLQSWVDEAVENENGNNKKRTACTSSTSPCGKKGKKTAPSITAKSISSVSSLPAVTPNVGGSSSSNWLNSTPSDPYSAATDTHNPITPTHIFAENSAKICVERKGHIIFFSENTIYVHGGEDKDGGTLGDVLAFRMSPDTRLSSGKDLVAAAAPLSLTRALCDLQKRCWHTSQFLADSKLLVVFGGECRLNETTDEASYLEDCFVFDARIELWYPACVSGKGPSARSGCSSGLIGKDMVVYGGHKDHRYLHNIHVLDTERWHWSSPKCDGPPPSARGGHSCTFIGANRLLIFGGSNGWEWFNDVHVLSRNDRGSGWLWERALAKGVVPRPRWRHTAVALAGGRYVLVRGGSAMEGGSGADRDGAVKEDVFYDDAFILDTVEWTWAAARDAGTSAGYSTLVYSKTYLETAHHKNDCSTVSRSGEGAVAVVQVDKTHLVYFGGSSGVDAIGGSLYCVEEGLFL